MPIIDPSNVSTVKIVTNMDDAASDLQTSIRATVGANDELIDISYIRQADGNGVVIIYVYEDMP